MLAGMAEAMRGARKESGYGPPEGPPDVASVGIVYVPEDEPWQKWLAWQLDNAGFPVEAHVGQRSEGTLVASDLVAAATPACVLVCSTRSRPYFRLDAEMSSPPLVAVIRVNVDG